MQTQIWTLQARYWTLSYLHREAMATFDEDTAGTSKEKLSEACTHVCLLKDIPYFGLLMMVMESALAASPDWVLRFSLALVTVRVISCDSHHFHSHPTIQWAPVLCMEVSLFIMLSISSDSNPERDLIFSNPGSTHTCKYLFIYLKKSFYIHMGWLVASFLIRVLYPYF